MGPEARGRPAEQDAPEAVPGGRRVQHRGASVARVGPHGAAAAGGAGGAGAAKAVERELLALALQGYPRAMLRRA